MFAGSNERCRSMYTQNKEGCLFILRLIASFFTVNLVNLSVILHEQIYIYTNTSQYNSYIYIHI